MFLLLVTSLYSHDIILVLFYWVIKQDYKCYNKRLATGDWSQSIPHPAPSIIQIVMSNTANQQSDMHEQ